MLFIVGMVKERDGNVLRNDNNVRAKWKEYFGKLMKDENQNEKKVGSTEAAEQRSAK